MTDVFFASSFIEDIILVLLLNLLLLHEQDSLDKHMQILPMMG